GSLLIFGAVGCEGVFILLNKRIQTPIAPLALSTIMAAFGLAVAVIPAGFEMPWMHSLSGDALAAVAYYALIPTVGGFLLWYAGAARVSGAEAALFTAVAPVSAVVLAATLLGEQIGQSQIIGIGCVLVAVFSLGMSQSTDMTDSAMADAEGDAASYR
ncbi:MAG TPA: EamA family transporter, partial [Cupriavidus sp.]|nr:EamA family transporter [Cupriavidus sp.]